LPALREQEQGARSERERLSGEARAKSEAASSARDALDRQVAGEQQHSGELTAQLAALRGTTAALEGEYRQGQAALAAYEAAQAAKRAAAEEQARRQAAAAAQQPKQPAPAAPAAVGVNPAPANSARPRLPTIKLLPFRTRRQRRRPSQARPPSSFLPFPVELATIRPGRNATRPDALLPLDGARTNSCAWPGCGPRNPTG
jgi:peptidoglycan DL-endopeptidase CwlO